MIKKIKLWLFKNFCNDILERITTAVGYIKYNNMQNDQWVLDWIDKINKLSVEI